MFRIYTTRSNYWSLSKLAKRVNEWLEAPKRPSFGTREEWQAYHNLLKSHKLAYWLDDTFWDGLQNVVYYPSDVYYELKYAFKNRFTRHRWSLTSDLPKWKYRDYRTTLLHATFDSFVNDFLIGEKGRGTKEGLFKHWEWEHNLTNDSCGYYGDDSDHPPDELIPQALNSRKEAELYRWWLIRRHEINNYAFDSFEEENRLDEIDNEKLKELIDMRLNYWT